MDLLNVVFRVVTPPANLPHTSAAQEIMRLPQFLEARVQSTSGGMAFINTGTVPPSGPAASWPWFKQGADGRPVDILVNVGGQWIPAIPGREKFVQAPGDNWGIRQGTGSITVPGGTTPTSTVIGDVINYANVFSGEPFAILSLRYHSTMGSETGAYGLRLLAAVDHSSTTFRVVAVYRPTSGNLGGDVTLPFSWMLLGPLVTT